MSSRLASDPDFWKAGVGRRISLSFPATEREGLPGIRVNLSQITRSVRRVSRSLHSRTRTPGPLPSQPLAPLVSTQQGTVPGVLGSQSWDAALNSAWAFSLQATKGRGGSRKQTMGSRACLPACPALLQKLLPLRVRVRANTPSDLATRSVASGPAVTFSRGLSAHGLSLSPDSHHLTTRQVTHPTAWVPSSGHLVEGFFHCLIYPQPQTFSPTLDSSHQGRLFPVLCQAPEVPQPPASVFLSHKLVHTVKPFLSPTVE